ncbi:MAG: hypothetical protein IT160_06730 [Bryobacterales bacterium]|nr:hypothetical protein [Bryobacterales bacterium]
MTIRPLVLFALAASLFAASDHPVFQVDVPHPTADKPQSKVWYTGGSWWALLPRQSGPSLWQRTASGWKEHTAVTTALSGLPGRGDVWFDSDGVTAVVMSGHSYAVIRLRPHGTTWAPKVLARWEAASSRPVETSTIARDGRKRWWVSSTVSNRVLVWTSANGENWTGPTVIGDGLDEDDICAVTPIRGGVGVFWSNQAVEGVFFRVHRDQAAAGAWDPVETVEIGNRTADDHINAALTADGTLWVATKNSVDIVGKPQQVLRLRSATGHWRNIPYSILDKTYGPSRPVVVVAPDRKTVYYGHTIYNRSSRIQDRIEFGRIDLASPQSLETPEVVILPSPALHSRVNDITRAKAPLPADGPWLVLASDGEGRVYESDLRMLKAARH